MTHHSKIRYRFYREHKYVCYMLSELEKTIAKTDFRNPTQIQTIKNQLNNIEDLMTGHAEWEESSIHELLRKKQSSIHELIENDHKEHAEQFKKLKEMLSAITDSTHEQEQIHQGYEFYLTYRLFNANNLKHLHDEETIIMPELQKLYSDDELRAIEFGTYAQMTSEQMVEMMSVLFPHMNASDWEFFLRDIRDAQPEKFLEAWEGVALLIDVNEREMLVRRLALNT